MSHWVPFLYIVSYHIIYIFLTVHPSPDHPASSLSFDAASVYRSSGGVGVYSIFGFLFELGMLPAYFYFSYVCIFYRR